MIQRVGIWVGVIRDVVGGLYFCGGFGCELWCHGVDAVHREEGVVEMAGSVGIHLRCDGGIARDVDGDATF